MNEYGHEEMNFDSSQNLVSPTPLPGIPPSLPAPVQPVVESERIVTLDVIRGVALFGILFVNIQDCAMVKPARYFPMTGDGDDTVNQDIWLITHRLAESKFSDILSMLFGTGIVLLSDRWRRRGHPACSC